MSLFLYLMFPGINTEVNDTTLSRLNNDRPTELTVADQMITYVWDNAPLKCNLEYEKTWFEVSYFLLVASPSPRQNFVQISQVTNHFASLRSGPFPSGFHTKLSMHFASPPISACHMFRPPHPPGEYSYCDRSTIHETHYVIVASISQTPPLWGPNIFFSIRFPNIGSSSSLTVRHRV